jgi:ergothioneine biosynthesis protein EgtB
MTPRRTTNTTGKGRAHHATDAHAASLAHQYEAVRHFSETLCEPLVTEDYVIQTMPDVSPTKWHLAHTSWFFETFVLTPWARGYTPIDPAYKYLFNSYYNAVGDPFPRPHRGTLSRPTVEDVLAYRRHVDEHMAALLERGEAATGTELAELITIGLHHEQQHQELMLTDIKHVLSCNPLKPPYRERTPAPSPRVPKMEWKTYPEGLYEIGHGDEKSFAYDNERPRHRVFLEAFRIGSRLVTCGEYLEFMRDGGYERPEYWLSDGWAAAQERRWKAPLYWEKKDDTWWHYTLGGMMPVDPNEPVCHVSLYEADAFARWAGLRLPTEAEWEVAAASVSDSGHFAEDGVFHPQPVDAGRQGRAPRQMLGDAWEWTASAYLPYPGFEAASGALGEYNGKFMCNQMVLRGGSCATPRTHIRRTYRNFFQPEKRWQFTGIRLARTT